MHDRGALAGPKDLRLLNEQLAESLRAAEQASELNADLYDRAPLAYLITDRAGVIQRANQDAAGLLCPEEPRRQLVGVRARRLVMDEDAAILTGHLRACSATDRAERCEVRLRDGRPVQLWTRRLAPIGAPSRR